MQRQHSALRQCMRRTKSTGDLRPRRSEYRGSDCRAGRAVSFTRQKTVGGFDGAHSPPLLSAAFLRLLWRYRETGHGQLWSFDSALIVRVWLRNRWLCTTLYWRGGGFEPSVPEPLIRSKAQTEAGAGAGVAGRCIMLLDGPRLRLAACVGPKALFNDKRLSNPSPA